jgi:hypothetical protein
MLVEHISSNEIPIGRIGLICLQPVGMQLIEYTCVIPLKVYGILAVDQVMTNQNNRERKKWKLQKIKQHSWRQ